MALDRNIAAVSGEQVVLHVHQRDRHLGAANHPGPVPPSHVGVTAHFYTEKDPLDLVSIDVLAWPTTPS